MDYNQLLINDSIIRSISIFDSNKKLQVLKNELHSNGYIDELFQEYDLDFFKNSYYAEFRDFVFSNSSKDSINTLRKDFNEVFLFHKKGTQIKLNYCKIFLFPEGLHFFLLDFTPIGNTLNVISDTTFCIQKLELNNLISNEEQPTIEWIKCIESNCLKGNKILSTKEKHVSVDDYSGSKFKLFTVIDLEKQVSHEERLHLLYDIGCNARIGSAAGNDENSPSHDYFKELTNNKVSVFKNYDILPLFDSFTVIGNHILSPEIWKRSTWETTYFRIILYNLFIKYNLFKFNKEVKEDSIQTRNKFESFVNKYNFSHISFNFLPNLLFKNHRKALEIDSELSLFQERINRINQEIQERQQSRMNTLISIVTVLSSLSSISPIYDIVDTFRVKHDWSNTLFYGVLSIPFFIIAFVLVRFIFPDQTKIILTKIKKTIKN